ncbi:uncharacterized protein LOC112010488 [Quercus suber]|uniref:uncharacterized protein LOC112010488 n=1 Tax=Quercus suber TaxID=58331 RepID=UPI0032DE7E05
MQREIDNLKRKLRHARQRRAEPSPDLPSNDEYRQGSRTPPSETFSHEEERYQRRKRDILTPRGLGSDAMSKALDRLSRSPFTHRIEEAMLPRRFQQPTFTVYNGKTDPVEHVSQFNQRMAVHSKNEALMCKVFPSSLGPVAMSKPPRLISALLSLSVRDGETLKAYSDKYWEVYNDLDGKYDAVAINTFQNGLPMGHGLRKSLTGKPATSVRQLMDWIDKYKLVDEDMLQGKGKEKVIPQERRDFRSDRYSNARPRRDFSGQSGATNAQTVSVVFREPVHKVLEKIKDEPYFRWPNKVAGEPEKRN